MTVTVVVLKLSVVQFKTHVVLFKQTMVLFISRVAQSNLNIDSKLSFLLCWTAGSHLELCPSYGKSQR